jgi:hypothetical protein
MRFPPSFDEIETAILLEIYDQPDGTYDSYTLLRKVNPGVPSGSEQAVNALTRICAATENLIERGFVRGKRLRGADGVYFNSLRLTRKGEQNAIRQKKESEKAKKGPRQSNGRINSTPTKKPPIACLKPRL